MRLVFGSFLGARLAGVDFERTNCSKWNQGLMNWNGRINACHIFEEAYVDEGVVMGSFGLL